MLKNFPMTPLLAISTLCLWLLMLFFWVTVQGRFSETPRFATVNISEAVQLREASLLSRRLSAEEISSEAESFAGKLRTVLDEIQKDCGCTLLVKAAVVSPSGLPDYTDCLIDRLGLKREGPKNLFREHIL